MSEELIGEVAHEILHITTERLRDLALEVGALIFAKFYGSDVARWRSHGQKDVSLRRLAEALGDDEHFSASNLYRWVAIHLVMKRLGADPAWKSLTPSHVRLVLPLDEDDQESLLREAAEKKWTARDLENAVADRRPAVSRGRPPLPRFVRTIRQLHRVVDDRERAFGDLDRVAVLDEATATEVYGLLVYIVEQLEAVLPDVSPKRVAALREHARPAGTKTTPRRR